MIENLAQDMNPRMGEYLAYLDQHISGVKQAWYQFLASVVLEQFPDYYSECERAILSHDASKYDEDEFCAYCNYFYPCPGYPKDQDEFDRAWLLHQKRNPHHWQYWILVHDEGEAEPLQMPISEICNMVCDWHSFSKRDPKSTAYSWYQKNKDNMILDDTTRSYVEFFVDYLKDPIQI